MRSFTPFLTALALLGFASPAAAANRLVHVGGNCSNGWENSYHSVGSYGAANSGVDQRYDHDDAVVQLRNYLDAQCTGNDNCIIYAFSNGAAVTSEAIATYDTSGTRWNITYVLTTGGNEGGSELSDIADTPVVGDIAQWLTCGMSDQIGPSDHRNGWNHHNTGGNTIYGVAGWDRIWVPFQYISVHPLILGRHDSVVGYHSAYMMVERADVNDAWDRPQWTNHVVAGTSEGIRTTHGNMPDRGLPCMYGNGC